MKMRYIFLILLFIQGIGILILSQNEAIDIDLFSSSNKTYISFDDHQAKWEASEEIYIAIIQELLYTEEVKENRQPYQTFHIYKATVIHKFKGEKVTYQHLIAIKASIPVLPGETYIISKQLESDVFQSFNAFSNTVISNPYGLMHIEDYNEAIDILEQEAHIKQYFEPYLLLMP